MEIFDDFTTSAVKMIRASTDKKLIFSYGKKLAREDKRYFRYFIFVYNNATGEPVNRFEFKQDKCAFVSIGSGSSN